MNEQHEHLDVATHLDGFQAERNPSARYASFDYCFNFFQDARDNGTLKTLTDDDQLPTACLQLGFYLASWGMMRGPAELLRRSVKVYEPVIEAIANEPGDAWTMDAPLLGQNYNAVLESAKRIRSSFIGFNASDTLVTKVMLGVFGSVLAFDRYFRKSFGCQTLCRSALERISDFYVKKQAFLDAHTIQTFELSTGSDTNRLYTKSKLIDMIFFQKGLDDERAAEAAKKAGLAKLQS